MTREELKEHCRKTVEQCEMWAIHRGEEPSGKVYEEHKAVLDILEQEPTDKPMCDRNICISNEYSGIGCDKCIVNKAEQEPCTDAISRESAKKLYCREICSVVMNCKEQFTLDCKRLKKFDELPSVTQKCEKCAMNGSGSKYCDNCKPKGHWIVLPPIYEEICECSSCHKRFKQALQIGNKPCPNCGAKMESEDKG